MRFDTVIVGGGLSGLTAGIKLLKEGQRVAIVSAGQSALHFFSGSIELLGKIDGKEVTEPFKEIENLPDEHPLKRVGTENVRRLLSEVKPMWTEAGLTLKGDGEKNHYRLSPIGVMKPGWLTIDDYVTFDSKDTLPWKEIALVNIEGYLDFYPKFLAASLEKRGAKCDIKSVSLPEIDKMRCSHSEMRSTNMARVVTDGVINELARKINSVIGGAEVVLMPAIVGLFKEEPFKKLRSLVDKPLFTVATMPITVPGARAQICLREHFRSLGGEYLLGDTVNTATYEGSKMKAIGTVNMGFEALYADNFILASGSFFSHGLIATPYRIYDPAFDLDIDAPQDRKEWFSEKLYDNQPYMTFGVKTDNSFHAIRNDSVIDNLYVAGAIHPGCDPMKEGCGGGVSLATSLRVAEFINKH